MRPAGRKPLSASTVPLVAERFAAGVERQRLRRRQSRDRGVLPEAQFGERPRDLDVGAARVDDEVLAGEAVRRLAGAARLEARVAPARGRHFRLVRVDRFVEVGLLVGGQRPVRRCPAPSLLGPQRVFQKTSLPLKKARLTPASRAASTAAAFARRPVLVVAAGDEDFVVLQQFRVCGDVRLGQVGHVVALFFEEPHHLVFGVERVRLAAVGCQGAVEGPVVGDRVGRLVAFRFAFRAPSLVHV